MLGTWLGWSVDIGKESTEGHAQPLGYPLQRRQGDVLFAPLDGGRARDKGRVKLPMQTLSQVVCAGRYKRTQHVERP